MDTKRDIWIAALSQLPPYQLTGNHLMAITTTEATKAQYRKRARQLKERLARRYGCPVDEISPMALVEDLLSRKEVAVHDSDALAASIVIALAPGQDPDALLRKLPHPVDTP